MGSATPPSACQIIDFVLIVTFCKNLIKIGSLYRIAAIGTVAFNAINKQSKEDGQGVGEGGCVTIH